MRRVVLAVVLALVGAAARAEEKLLFAPAPTWVKPGEAIKVEPPPAEGLPLTPLRLDQQFRFGPEGDAAYVETVSQIRTTMGLSMAGTLGLSWDPSRETVTVHKVRVRRGEAVIDVLAKQTFNIIRREENLRELVDGRLTASLQPEDLRVGDVVEFAFTRVRNDPVLKGRTDYSLNALGSRGLKDYRLRATWPTDRALTWRFGSGLPKPKVERRGGLTELLLEARDPPEAKAPSGAPRRFFPDREVQFSGFKTWTEVSAHLADAFEAASTLAPDSPLRAEVAKIRAASSDPKVQAAMALKLVQEEVRYLGLLLQDGGYTPVAADKTWERRFGECKAKSVLLIALLRALDIEAEPAVVNAYGAEGLDQELPRLSAFNHVIVRATIGGKVYWMDGTRPGDGALSTLSVPTHDWALPLRRTGGELIALVVPPLTAPTSEITLDVDAREGLFAPAKVTGEMIMRGDIAIWPTLMSKNLPAAEREQMLKGMWSRYRGLEIKTVAAERDPETGAATFRMTGEMKLDWVGGNNGRAWHVLRDGRLGWPARYKREPDEDQTAPYQVNHPKYDATRFRIRLPQNGEGFAAPAEDEDRTVAGVRLVRKTVIAGDTITIETSQRSIAAEFPASEAAQAETTLTEMARKIVAIQAPWAYRNTPADAQALLKEEPKTALDYAQRGFRLAGANRFDAALADYAKAIEMDPKNGRILASRGLLHLQRGAFDLAKTDLAEAERLEPRIVQVQLGLAGIAMRDERFADAVAALTRASDMEPTHQGALFMRAEAFLRQGQRDKAIADYGEVLRIDPKANDALVARAKAKAGGGDYTGALADLDAALAIAPKDEEALLYRPATLVRMGRREDADKAFADALAVQPSARLYLTRSANRPRSDFAGREQDIAAALKLEPEFPGHAAVQARLHIDKGEPAKAVAILDQAIKESPKGLDLRFARAEALVKAGLTARAIADYQAIRAMVSGEAMGLNNLCWSQATLNVALEAALSDCDAAVKILPKNPAIADSRAFVLLRLGRLDDAVAAYDAALAMRDSHAQSLYGRGLAKRRLGRSAEAETDFAAARKAEPRIDEEFAEYGLEAPKAAPPQAAALSGA